MTVKVHFLRQPLTAEQRLFGMDIETVIGDLADQWDDENNVDTNYRKVLVNDEDADPSVVLFTWLDHFGYLIFTPVVLFLNFDGYLNYCSTSGSTPITTSFLCHFGIQSGDHHDGMTCIAVVISSFIVSLYLYTISLYEIAPGIYDPYGMMSSRNGPCGPILRRSILFLPIIMINIIFMLFLCGFTEMALLVLLATAVLFTCFSIFVAAYICHVEFNKYTGMQ
jgi:hypothetical protein